MRGQSLSAGMNLYLRDGQDMGDEPFTEADAREAWFRNRGELMRLCPPNPVPHGLFHFEFGLFENLPDIRALRLTIRDLQYGRAEFMEHASWHLSQGRPELAAKFERLRTNVNAIISELEGAPK